VARAAAYRSPTASKLGVADASGKSGCAEPVPSSEGRHRLGQKWLWARRVYALDAVCYLAHAWSGWTCAYWASPFALLCDFCGKWRGEGDICEHGGIVWVSPGRRAALSCALGRSHGKATATNRLKGVTYRGTWRCQANARRRKTSCFTKRRRQCLLHCM
jgi:hypothetical protein